MKIDLDALAMTMNEPEPIATSFRTACTKQFLALAKARGLRETAAILAVSEYCPNLYANMKDGCRNADRRGLLLLGPPGTGKTMALYLVSGLFGIEFLRAGEVAAVFASLGEEAFWDKMSSYRGHPVIVDDLGAERDTKNFGNAPPIAEWLQRRYNSWQLGGPETHIASNLSQEDLALRYTERVLDRMREMMIPKVITGESMRR